jgi:hypothetical protein
MQTVVPEFPYKLAPDYTYVELPLVPVRDEDGDVVTKFARNQTHVLQSPVTVQAVANYKILVSVNRELLKYANCPALFIVDPANAAERIEVVAQFRKDMPLDAISWIARLYLIS